MTVEQAKVGTITVVGLPTTTPSTVFRASSRVMRLLVRNVGPTAIRLAYSSTALTGQSADGTDHYQLISGGEDVFILMPQQGLYAISVGNGGQLSYAASEALPAGGHS